MSGGSEPERVWLFRAISVAELQDIWQIGGFRPGAGTLETKLFTLSRDAAAWFGQALYGANGADFAIVELCIPARVAARFDTLRVDGMQIVAVYLEQLAELNAALIQLLPRPSLEDLHGRHHDV
jgi:hypothetical protein